MALTGVGTRSELWQRALDADPGRRQLAGAGDAGGRARRAAVRAARRRARTSRTPTAAATSTGSCPGGRCSSGTPTRRRSRRWSRPRATGRASARRPSARSSSPPRSSTRCRRSRRCGSSRPAPRPRMSAIRLARGFTRRDRILKFAGCYHGHVDALLADAGSGRRDARDPGEPRACRRRSRADTIVCPYNDADAAAAAVARYGEGLAAIIVEPVAGNMGVVPPEPGFLEALRVLCDASGALLDLRRGDHGLPRRARRRAGALRHPARPDDPRQDPRRRPAASRPSAAAPT